MRSPQLVNDFIQWRWAPCVGLTAGSLAFVALALLLIPTRVGGEPPAVSALNSYEAPRPQRAIFSSALARPNEAEDRRPEPVRIARVAPQPLPRSSEASAPMQRGFSPIIERPEPVAARVPVPAPVAVPAPMAVAIPVPSATAIATATATALAPAEVGTPMPGSVVIQPVPGGESREVAQ